MTETTHLGLPFIEGSQAQKHVTHNEALRILDAAIQIVVEDRTRTTPPASAAEGQRHVVASGAAGAWAGHDATIATWQDGAWIFLAPKTGWRLWSVADVSIFIFDGSAWQPLAPLANDVGQLGVNTTASTPNLLSVKSNAALLAAIPAADAGSGDARLQIDKETAGNTASVVFSNDYTGRAEFGLTGDDHFHLKVSPDGTSWQDAFVIDKTTANVSFNGFSDAARTRRQLSDAVRAVTGADTIGASDIGRTLIFNSASAFTVAIAAAVTLGNGFWCRFKNVGSGLVTIDPDASETIDGLATGIVPKSDSGILICDGTGFQTLERPSVVLLDSGSFSASATLSLALPAGFDVFEFFLNDVKPSANALINGRISKDSGSSYVTGYEYAYTYQNTATPATLSTGGAAAQTYMLFSGTADSGATGVSARISSQNLTTNSSYTKLSFEAMYANSGNRTRIEGHNWLTTYDAYNFLQIFPSTGNFASGTWQAFGRRKLL